MFADVPSAPEVSLHEAEAQMAICCWKENGAHHPVGQLRERD